MSQCRLNRWFKKTLAMVLMLVAGVANADQIRVLLGFDNSGHHVHQVIEVDSTFAAQYSQEALEPIANGNLSPLIRSLEPGVAFIAWFDEQMQLVAVTRESDPRVSSSPAHIQGQSESRRADYSGAWLVDGPATANNMTILLPDNPQLHLSFEQWSVSITP